MKAPRVLDAVVKSYQFNHGLILSGLLAVIPFNINSATAGTSAAAGTAAAGSATASAATGLKAATVRLPVGCSSLRLS
jgi:hypothetical protein